LKALSGRVLIIRKDLSLLNRLYRPVLVITILIFTVNNHNLSLDNHAQNFDYVKKSENSDSQVLRFPLIAKDYSSVIQLSSARNINWINRNQEILNNTLSHSPGEMLLIISGKNKGYGDCLRSTISFREVGRGGSATIPIFPPQGGRISEIELHAFIAKAFPLLPIGGDRDKSLSCL